MATRLYLHSQVTAASSPTVQAGWNVTTGNLYKMLYPGKTLYASGTAVNTITSAQVGAAAPRKVLIQTYLTQPLPAQTINSASTISGQIKCALNSTTSTTGQLFVYIRLCNEDGTNITEIGNITSTNLVAPTNTNRTITITLGSNVTIAARQRIIFEIGWNMSVGTVTTRTTSIVSQLAVATADLPVDNISTLGLNPWIEFSQTLNLIVGSNFFM